MGYILFHALLLAHLKPLLNMPTIFAHAAVPLTIALVQGRARIPFVLLLLGILGAIAPDFDVALMRLGVPYASEYGHRGASHSIVFAALLGAVLAPVYQRLTSGKGWHAFWFVFVCTLSHPLLDMCTNGGHGVALFWPLSDARVFFPFRPVQVSPLSLKQFLGPAGLKVLMSEALWIWLPALSVAALIWLGRKFPRGH